MWFKRNWIVILWSKVKRWKNWSEGMCEFLTRQPLFNFPHGFLQQSHTPCVAHPEPKVGRRTGISLEFWEKYEIVQKMAAHPAYRCFTSRPPPLGVEAKPFHPTYMTSAVATLSLLPNRMGQFRRGHQIRLWFAWHPSCPVHELRHAQPMLKSSTIFCHQLAFCYFAPFPMLFRSPPYAPSGP